MMYSDAMTTIERDPETGTWYVACALWRNRRWEGQPSLTGFALRRDAIAAAHEYRKAHVPPMTEGEARAMWGNR